jgi:TonB family protein
MGGSLITIVLVTALSVVSAPVARFNLLQSQAIPRIYRDGPRLSSPSRLHLTEGASRKLLLKEVKPEFPNNARGSGIEGDVVFKIVIGKAGNVEEIHLRSGKPSLIEPAAKAISKWRYEPYELNGKVVEIDTFATVRFRLTGDNH